MKPPPGWGQSPPSPPPPPAWPTRPPPSPLHAEPDGPPPRDPSGPNRVLVGAIAAGLLFLIALTVSGARSLGRDKGHPDHSSVALRAGVGAAIALGVAVVAVVVASRASRSDTPIARAILPERPITTRSLVARSLPWAVAAVALGAVLGSATAPLYREGTSARDDSTGAPVDPRLPELEGRLAQDENGEVYVQVDPEGDGRWATLVPCENGASEGPSVYGPDPEPGDPVLVPIDYECDGIIDAYARVESFEIEERFESGPPTTAPGTGRPLPSDPSTDTYGNDSSDVTQRYDGIYAYDDDGELRLYLDTDGDGTYETPTAPCPLDSGAEIPPSTSVPSTGSALVPIDVDCNGDIDAYARVDDFEPRSSPPREATEVGPPVIPPRDRTGPQGDDADSGDTRGDDTDDGDDGDGGGLPLTVIVVLIAVVGAALAALAYAASRGMLRSSDDASDATDDADDAAAGAADAIASSIGAMSEPFDPREGIIRAYARLLDGLAANGTPRRPSETPEMYLRRCVDQLGVPRGPMEELTRLFTLARFSSHPIDERQRAAATACLERSLADIRARAERIAAAEPVGATP